MSSEMDKLQTALQNPLEQPVYYLSSTEKTLLQEAAAQVRRALWAARDDEEVTVIEGPVPDMGDAVAAAGAISFFGTPRFVELQHISPASMGDKDLAELSALFEESVNAILLVTALHKDKRAATGKKAKALLAAARKNGVGLELAPPTRRDNLALLQQQASALGASFAPGAAEALLERAGEDRDLLRNEVAKLAAFCGYGVIDTAAVTQYATHHVEADVFELIRLILSGNKTAAHQKLSQLLFLRHEPVAVVAALAGSYTDMLRVRLGEDSGHSLAAVHSDFAYQGSDYRLKIARQNAAHYPGGRLYDCVLLLANLDRELKRSALPDKNVLLQAALSQLIQLRHR